MVHLIRKYGMTLLMRKEKGPSLVHPPSSESDQWFIWSENLQIYKDFAIKWGKRPGLDSGPSSKIKGKTWFIWSENLEWGKRKDPVRTIFQNNNHEMVHLIRKFRKGTSQSRMATRIAKSDNCTQHTEILRMVELQGVGGDWWVGLLKLLLHGS